MAPLVALTNCLLACEKVRRNLVSMRGYILRGGHMTFVCAVPELLHRARIQIWARKSEDGTNPHLTQTQQSHPIHNLRNLFHEVTQHTYCSLCLCRCFILERNPQCFMLPTVAIMLI